MVRPLRSPDLRRRRRIRTIKRFLPWTVLFLIIVALPLWFINSKHLRINYVLVSGTVGINPEEIKESADSLLKGRYFFIIPRNSSLFYPKEKIISTIEKEFPRAESLKVELEGVSQLNVTLRERAPDTLWCEAFPTNCFFMDERGYIFDKAGDFSDADLFFVYEGLIEGDPLGNFYLPQDDFIKVKNFITEVGTLSLSPASLRAISEDSFELYVSGGILIFSTKDDLSEVALNLASVLSDRTLDVYQNGALTVKSIDLRYGNKVIIGR
jgi:cell division septal protein FtsQ